GWESTSPPAHIFSLPSRRFPAHPRGIRRVSAAAPSVAPACARSLSLQNVPESERRERASRVQDGMEEPAFTKSALTVLIVDDEELLVRSCARILEHEGYTVQQASRGREALDLMRRQRPDIVLTDLMLPDVDGMTLLREAKRLDPEMLVIMITGFATVDSSIEAIKAGAYDYIPKPFTATQLQILIGRAANQVRLARDNER